MLIESLPYHIILLSIWIYFCLKKRISNYFVLAKEFGLVVTKLIHNMRMLERCSYVKGPWFDLRQYNPCGEAKLVESLTVLPSKEGTEERQKKVFVFLM